MGKIVISENITLDGVIQDPTGEEGFAHGGWFNLVGDGDRAAWAQVQLEEALAAEALLLGRRSYEYLAPRWMARTGEWADRLAGMPKYVVSSTLTDLEWNNSTVLKGEVVHEVSALKQRVDGDVVLNASGRLARTLLEHDLVDELRLMMYPFALGSGDRLFGGFSDRKTLRLAGTRSVGEGLALLTYEFVRTP